MHLNDLYGYFRNELKPFFHSEEITALAKIIFRDIAGVKFQDIFINGERIIDDELCSRVHKAIRQLRKQMPAQYITGICEFYGLRLNVTPNVLIPRPETEELVDWIINDNRVCRKKNIRILDIGTGSGNIAITLKNKIPSAIVTATDISNRALTVAKENAGIYCTPVKFLRLDILKRLNWSNRNPIIDKSGQFDIIASNPPYVPLNEKKSLPENVRNFEPHVALFTEQKNPLIFYDAIGRFALRQLKNNGLLYLEIHETKGKQVKSLLKRLGFGDVKIKKDINGKDRMVRCGKQ